MHQLGSTSTFGDTQSKSSSFINGIYQQRDYYSGIMQTWLTCVPSFILEVQYPIPPLSYMLIDIFAYHAGSSM